MNRQKCAPAAGFIAAGVLSLIYGIIVVAIIGTGHWFNFAFVLLGLGLIAYAFAWPYIKARKWLKRAVTVIIAIALIPFAGFEMRAVSFGNSRPAPNADYVMILGAKVNGSSPSLEFAARLRVAAKYLEDNPGSMAITTGGKGSDEGLAEGDAAKRYLMGLGIDESRILVENQSTTTQENMKFAKDLINQRANRDCGMEINDNVVIVSSSFHLYRSSIYAELYGFENTSFLGSTGLKILLPQYYVREFAAFVRELPSLM